MGAKQLRFYSELAAVTADIIADQPQAAALIARRLEQLFKREACREEDEQAEREQRERARGFQP